MISNVSIFIMEEYDNIIIVQIHYDNTQLVDSSGNTNISKKDKRRRGELDKKGLNVQS